MEKIQLIPLSLALFCCFLYAPRAAAQSDSRVEAGANYNYARTNAAPGDCGCISLQGGTGWVSYNFTHSLGLVGELGTQHSTDISPFASNLTLISYMGGIRYKKNIGRQLSPFVQVVAGGAHANGSMAPGNSGIPGSSNAFAMAAGGGLDIQFFRLFAFRIIQADYYYTRFPNGVNDHQNNLRIGAGLVVRFGSR